MKMPPLAIFMAALVSAWGHAYADLPGAPAPVAGSLLDTPETAVEGRWAVTMSYGEGEEAVVEMLVINSASAGGLQGGFLGAPFGESAMRKQGASTVFFTQTDDGSGPIYHSGRITGAAITGQSYFTSRKELLPWSGQRAQKADSAE